MQHFAEGSTACDGNSRPDDPGRASDRPVPIGMPDVALRPDQDAVPRPAERWRGQGLAPAGGGEEVVIRWWRETKGAGPPEAHELVARAPAMLLVGRLANSDIVLADETVSRLHAKISIVGDRVEITDMQSANGTELDGKRVGRGVWTAGQRLRIGRFAFELVERGCGPENVAGDQAETGPQAIRLRVAVTHGNVVDRTADVLALGLLDTVFASAAARDVNRASGDIVNTLHKSGRVDVRLGATHLVPVAQGCLSYDYLLLVGLGSADALGSRADAGGRKALVEGALHSLGLYAFEYLLQFKLRSMATILSLAGAAEDPGQLARQLIRGCLRSALSWKQEGGTVPLPLLTLCETDRARHGQILGALQEEAAALADPGYRAEIFGAPTASMAVTLAVAAEYAAGLPEHQPAASPPAPLEPVKLDVRALGQRAADGALEFELSCYRPAGYAYAETQRCVLSADVLASQLPQIYDIHQPLEHRIRLTEAIFERLLPLSIRRIIEEETASRPLCLCLDAAVAMIPWEALMVGSRPGTGRGISRMLRAAGRGGIRPILGTLALPIDLLLVVNPTGDLPEADREGERIARMATDRPECFNLTLLHGGEARKHRLIEALLRTRPHIMHFCGHGAFSLAKPRESGLICAGGDVLTGIDMYSINPMPNIVIFNACLSGRLIETEAGGIGGGGAGARPAAPMTSIAEAAIHGGVGSLIGTLWPVGDPAATTFSQIFYDSFLNHAPVGDAVARGRAAVLASHPGSFDWANYVLYGDESQSLRPARA